MTEKTKTISIVTVIIFTCFFKTLISLLVIYLSPMNLSPDEAQYWVWSQYLDFGYYSKPPGIAWQIFITTLYNQGEMGVRYGAIFWGLLLIYAVFRLSLLIGLPIRGAFLATIAFNFSPIGFASSMIATTDSGFIFFWIMAMTEMVKHFNLKGDYDLKKSGLFIALGSLFKWPIFLLWPLFILTKIIVRQKLPYGNLAKGILLSLVGLVPVIYWNYNHDWVTFKHVWTQSTGGHHSSDANFLEFIASQAGIFSPFLFILLIFSLARLPFIRLEASSKFIYTTCVIPLLIVSFLSLFSKMQANWALYAYPSGAVIIALYCTFYQFKYTKLFEYSIFLSIFLSLFSLFIPVHQSYFKGDIVQIPYKLNPFQQTLGWDRIGTIIDELSFDPEKEFLFADSYQTSSILSFYSGHLDRTYYMNLRGNRMNQFDFYPSAKQQDMGKDAYFVLSLNKHRSDDEIKQYQERIKNTLSVYFKEVKSLSYYPIFYAYGRAEKGLLFFKCYEYNGIEPATPSRY
jgi:hypothetical protein